MYLVFTSVFLRLSRREAEWFLASQTPHLRQQGIVGYTLHGSCAEKTTSESLN